MSGGIRITALQIQSRPCDRNANLDRSAAQIRQLGDTDLVVLPELSSPGYSDEVLKNKDQYAEDILQGPSFNFYSQLANECNCCIAYGILCLQRKNTITITHVVVAPGMSEPVASYDKIHLCQVGACSEVALGIAPGSLVPCAFEVRGVRIGLCICYDLRFPELWRKLAWEKNCDVILHPCAFSRDTTFFTWHQFVTTRAVENGVYVISTNYAGEQFGDSVASPPWVGNVVSGNGMERSSKLLVCRGTAEGLLNVFVDLKLLEMVRKMAPFRECQRFWRSKSKDGSE